MSYTTRLNFKPCSGTGLPGAHSHLHNNTQGKYNHDNVQAGSLSTVWHFPQVLLAVGAPHTSQN